MEWLYRLKLVRGDFFASGPTPDDLAAMQGHVGYLQKLADDGKLIVAGRTQVNDSTTMGIAIFRADSAVEAQAIAAADPVVQRGVMTVEVFPYKVAVAGSFSK